MAGAKAISASHGGILRRCPRAALLLACLAIAVPARTQPAGAPGTAAQEGDRGATDAQDRSSWVREYRHRHCPSAGTGQDIQARMVVIHWTATGTAEAARTYFARPEAEAGRRTLRAQGRLNVGTHFLVDRDGTAVELNPPDRFVRHVIGLNHVAVGIDLVGGAPRDLTARQLDAVEGLVRDLAARHPVRWLIGHHEADRFRGREPWCESVPGYHNRKADPGDAFMSALRRRVADLGLEGPPSAGP